MIFGKIENESIIQVNDKTRLSAIKTYISPDEADITKIEIQPESGADFIDVTENKYLDWSYGLDGEKTITLRVTTDYLPSEFSNNINVVSVADDNLFSGDSDLIEYEDDILSYVRDGRSSFLDKHRAAQMLILDDLDSAQIWKRDGSRFTASDIIDIQDFRRWSIFLTLKIIYESLSNAIDDVFSIKARKYSSMATEAKKRASLRLDVNQDGIISNNEIDSVDLTTGLLFRR